MKKNQIFCLLTGVLLIATSCAEEKASEEESRTSILDNVTTIIEQPIADMSGSFDYMESDLTAYIRVGDYKGLAVTRESEILTEEEFNEEIEVLLDSYSYYHEYTDRAVEEGDSIRVKYAGYKDGEAFEGGTSENSTLTAASGTGYIEGFAEAFIGQKPGEEFSFNVTFPDDYAEELAGQEVTFVCTVHAILGDELIVPELTDEFVQEKFSYNNAEEFLIAYRANMEEEKKYYVDSNMYSELWLQIVEGSEVIAYPEQEVLRIYNEQRAMYEQYAESFGTDYETFLANYLNVTDEELKEESRTYVKEDLVMYQLIKELNIEMTAEEYSNSLAFFAESYGMTSEELVAYYGEDTIRATVLWQKLMETVAADADITVE